MALDEQLIQRLETAVSKLEAIPSAPPAQDKRPAYEHLPITAEQAKIDGVTINIDGSIWSYEETEFSPTPGTSRKVKTPVGLCYGYYSAEKNPATHVKLLTLFGESYRNWYAARDPWALYKADIRDMVDKGTINWINFCWLMQPFSRFER
jgi:hypothetical protein